MSDDIANIDNRIRPCVTVSVRGLVEFLLRSGDIDNRSSSGPDPMAMLEGANIHRMIQRKMGIEYHSEVMLKNTTSFDEFDLTVEGRADGIIIPPEYEYIWTSGKELEDAEESAEKAADAADDEGNNEDNAEDVEALGILDEIIKRQAEDDGILAVDNEGVGAKARPVMIDEIKSTYRELEHIKEPETVHLAQAKCYAYMFASQNNLSEIAVRISYCNVDTHEMRYFTEEYTSDEICSWYDELIDEYAKWAHFEITFKALRNDSIRALKFPFTYREGQKELVAQVYRSIGNKERLFVMAPTGVGKTIAVMYPALKSMAEGMADKIFYLTAKTITRTVAADCLTNLRKQELRLKSVVLTAKDKICILEKSDCNPEKCDRAKGHYDRINDAIYDILTHEDVFTRELIEEYALKHMVCPFEMSLDMSLFSDAVICDYNYVFDPNVYLKRFFSDGVTGKYLFLTDEAHNLVDRAMSMYSAELYKEQFLEIKRLVRDTDQRLARALEAVNKHLLELKRECEHIVVHEHLDVLVMLLLRLMTRFETFFDDYEHFAEKEDVLDLYFCVRHFLHMYENMGESDYVIYTQLCDDGSFLVKLLCANPAASISRCTQKAVSTVFFSATMLPISYYRDMLGARESDPAVYAKSVFDPKKRGLFITRDVTSKYTRRSRAEYVKMAECIYNIASARAGNYMVFCPSHALLTEVYELYISEYYDENTTECIIQGALMTEEEREEFLGRFEQTQDDAAPNRPSESIKTLIGFCVLGGIFSEGIDLKNDALIGAIIIGTGLPMVCDERELLKNRYSNMGIDGFAYAYRYPGMNKVLQAAGRVIRTAEDVGVVALCDERFLNREYKALFPREWADYEVCSAMDIGEYAEHFWETESKTS